MTNPQEIPRAIIEWLHGFDAPPTVKAQGRSAEESEMILKFLEKVLLGSANDRCVHGPPVGKVPTNGRQAGAILAPPLRS